MPQTARRQRDRKKASSVAVASPFRSENAKGLLPAYEYGVGIGRPALIIVSNTRGSSGQHRIRLQIPPNARVIVSMPILDELRLLVIVLPGKRTESTPRWLPRNRESGTPPPPGTRRTSRAFRQLCCNSLHVESHAAQVHGAHGDSFPRAVGARAHRLHIQPVVASHRIPGAPNWTGKRAFKCCEPIGVPVPSSPSMNFA